MPKLPITIKPPVIQIAIDVGDIDSALRLAELGVKDQVKRAKEVQALGVENFYLHYGADERRADDSKDCTQWLDAVSSAVTMTVGCGTFGVEDGIVAAKGGADVIVIGHPLISGPDPLGALKDYCARVREAYRPRKGR